MFLSHRVLLAQHHEMVVLDIISEKVVMLNSAISNIICVIFDVNSTRKDFIVDLIIKLQIQSTEQEQSSRSTIGIYRHLMKRGSYNFKALTIQGIMQYIKSESTEVLAYESVLEIFLKEIEDLNVFKSLMDVIVVNRFEEDILDVKEKVYTIDIFNSDS